MKRSNQRLGFLSIYREHLTDELNQMKYGQVSQIAAKETLEPLDRVSGAIAVATMILGSTTINRG